MCISKAVSQCLGSLIKGGANSSHGALRQASIMARLSNKYLERRLEGPPTIKLNGGTQAFLHGSTKERFPFEPGHIFKVEKSKFFFAPPKDAAGYALGTNTSCERKKDPNDSSQPLIVLAMHDEDNPVNPKDIKFSEVGSGWWFVESGIRLRVSAAWIKNQETGLMEPYKPESWNSFYKKDFEDLTKKINLGFKSKDI